MKFVIDSGLKGQILWLLPQSHGAQVTPLKEEREAGLPELRGGWGLSRELGSEAGDSARSPA